jgi:phosphate transport system substrate-binding protein
LKPLLVSLTTAYSAQQPHLTFDIQGGGSQLGQRLVETQQADIGLVSWSPPDLSDEVRLTPIARDAIAIILNTQNQSKGPSLRELRDIFSGRLLNWQEVDGPPSPIQVISREDGSGTRATFETVVMEDRAVTLTAIVLPSSQAVVDFVAQNPNAIGYVSFAFIDDGVYAAPIEGVAPTLESLASGSYFLTRDLAIITPKQGKPEIDRFIEFVLSPVGQAIVGERWGRVK